MAGDPSATPPVLCNGFAPPPSVIDRYYNTRYVRQPAGAADAAGQPEDICIHFHNNGIAVIGLAASHPIIAHKLRLRRVEWSAAAAPLLTTVLVGKRKHGSASVAAGTVLCALHSACGRRFEVPAAVRGRLLEVNERLTAAMAAGSGEQTSTGLLEADWEWGGYVGIVLMDKPLLYDLIDDRDSRYYTAQRWQQLLNNSLTSSTDAR